MSQIEQYRGGAVSHKLQFDETDLKTLKETVAKDLTDSEFKLFAHICKERGLNPMVGQIYAIVRGQGQWRKVTFQTSIAAFRLNAQRSHEYAGQTEAQWCGPDGVWRNVWLEDKAPRAARVGVHRKGFLEPLYAVATLSEFYQTKSRTDANPNEMWAKMPSNQLAKCAEALALRKAFPEELSGLYTAEEFGEEEHQYSVIPDQSKPAVKGTKRRSALAPPKEELKPVANQEIIEAEIVEEPNPRAPISNVELERLNKRSQRLYIEIQKVGATREDVHALIEEKYGVSSTKELTSEEIDEVIAHFQSFNQQVPVEPTQQENIALWDELAWQQHIIRYNKRQGEIYKWAQVEKKWSNISNIESIILSDETTKHAIKQYIES